MSRSYFNFLTSVLALIVLCGALESLAQEAVPPAPAGEPMVDSPWFDVSWPKVEMPKLSWKPWGGDGGQPQAQGDSPIADTFERVSDVSGRAARSVREGFGSVMSKLPWGPGSAPPGSSTASNDGPGFWSRMFGPEEPRGSQTVTEFLAQERVSQVR